MPEFTIKMNDKEFRERINMKHKGVQESVKKEVKDSAKGVRSTLYSNTPVAPSFSATRTIQGGRTRPITVVGGEARSAFTESPKGRAQKIFKVKGYEAKIGGRVPLPGGYELFDLLERGTRAHGPVSARFLRFAVPAGVVFTRFVRGIRPHRIFLRTEQMWSRIFSGRIREAVRRGLHR